MHAKHPSTASKASVVSASIMYKKKLNYFIRKRKKDTENKLRRLKSKSPKQFWKILNNLQSKKENKDISINDIYIVFKDINSPNDSHDPESEILNFSIDNDDEIYNGHISENEILKCINNLKTIKHVQMMVL